MICFIHSGREFLPTNVTLKLLRIILEELVIPVTGINFVENDLKYKVGTVTCISLKSYDLHEKLFMMLTIVILMIFLSGGLAFMPMGWGFCG